MVLGKNSFAGWKAGTGVVLLILCIYLLVYCIYSNLSHTSTNVSGASGILRLKPVFEKFEENDYHLRTFMNASPTTVTSVKSPEYIPHLGSACFYIRSDFTAYTKSKSRPRPGYELRCLPKVYMVGFSKSGTSDLHQQLTQHQHIYGSIFKETHFWTQDMTTRDRKSSNMQHYTDLFSQSASLIESCCLSHLFLHESHASCAVDQTSPTTYSSNFNQRKLAKSDRKTSKLADAMNEDIRYHDHNQMSDTNCPITTIDSTPRYIWEAHYWRKDPANIHSMEKAKELLPDKLHHVLPDAKIIIIMRRPENRLWSDYNFYKQGKTSADDFHDKVIQGIKWWNSCIKLHAMEYCAYGNIYDDIENPKQGHAWANEGAERVRIGIYMAFVQKWLSVFDRSNVLILRFEDYVKDPIGYISRNILPFLSLDNFSHRSIKLIQANMEDGPKLQNKKSHKLEMRLDTRKLLQDFYEPYNIMLAKLLHDDRYLWNES